MQGGQLVDNHLVLLSGKPMKKATFVSCGHFVGGTGSIKSPLLHGAAVDMFAATANCCLFR